MLSLSHSYPLARCMWAYIVYVSSHEKEKNTLILALTGQIWGSFDSQQTTMKRQ